METLKQQFNSHSSEAVVHLRGRQRTLGAKDIRHWIERSRGWAALMAAVCVGEAQAGIPGRVSASERPMQRVEPTPPRLRRTGLSDASKAGEPAYPRYNRGAGEGLRPFEPQQTRAPVDRAGGGVAPVPPVTARPDG